MPRQRTAHTPATGATDLDRRSQQFVFLVSIIITTANDNNTGATALIKLMGVGVGVRVGVSQISDVFVGRAYWPMRRTGRE
jgi:hypothetical protein